MCKPCGGIITMFATTKISPTKKIFGKYGRNIPQIRGTPNSRTDMYDDVTGKLLQQRWFGPDGWALLDRDWEHGDNKKSHFFPHDQRWDYSKKEPRQEGEKADLLNFC